MRAETKRTPMMSTIDGLHFPSPARFPLEPGLGVRPDGKHLVAQPKEATLPSLMGSPPVGGANEVLCSGGGRRQGPALGRWEITSLVGKEGIREV